MKKADLLAAQAKLQLGQSQGFQHESERKKLEKELAKLQADLAKLTAQLRPYKEELARRGPGQPPQA